MSERPVPPQPFDSAAAAKAGFLPATASQRWSALCDAARSPRRTLYDFPDFFIPLLKATPHRIAEYATLLVSDNGDGLRFSDTRPSAALPRQRSLLPLPYRPLDEADFPQVDHPNGVDPETRRRGRAGWVFLMVAILNYHYLLAPRLQIWNAEFSVHGARSRRCNIKL